MYYTPNIIIEYTTFLSIVQETGQILMFKFIDTFAIFEIFLVMIRFRCYNPSPKEIKDKDSLAAREPVALAGFGTFTCRHRDARIGRNPATGKAMEFAASNTPIFKASKAFKEKVN